MEENEWVDGWWVEGGENVMELLLMLRKAYCCPEGYKKTPPTVPIEDDGEEEEGDGYKSLSCENSSNEDSFFAPACYSSSSSSFFSPFACLSLLAHLSSSFGWGCSATIQSKWNKCEFAPMN